jgi:hypothetical protein
MEQRAAVASALTLTLTQLTIAGVEASRRSLLAKSFLGVAAAAIATVASPAQEALAFGSGFPGYDVNLDGRKRAMERNKREMQADLARGESEQLSLFNAVLCTYTQAYGSWAHARDGVLVAPR